MVCGCGNSLQNWMILEKQTKGIIIVPVCTHTAHTGCTHQSTGSTCWTIRGSPSRQPDCNQFALWCVLEKFHLVTVNYFWNVYSWKPSKEWLSQFMPFFRGHSSKEWMQISNLPSELEIVIDGFEEWSLQIGIGLAKEGSPWISSVTIYEPENRRLHVFTKQ